jgi:hypothetical protein
MGCVLPGPLRMQGMQDAGEVPGARGMCTEGACLARQEQEEACLRLCGSQNSTRSFFHAFSSRSSASVCSLLFILLSLALSVTGDPEAAGWPAGVSLHAA